MVLSNSYDRSPTPFIGKFSSSFASLSRASNLNWRQYLVWKSGGFRPLLVPGFPSAKTILLTQHYPTNLSYSSRIVRSPHLHIHLLLSRQSSLCPIADSKLSSQRAVGTDKLSRSEIFSSYIHFTTSTNPALHPYSTLWQEDIALANPLLPTLTIRRYW